MTDSDREIAIVGFNDTPSPFPIAWPSTHKSLLPIVGKALIVHQIEHLVRTGVKEVRITNSVQQSVVRKLLKNGDAWGLNIKYSDLSPVDLISEYQALNKKFLYIVGDEVNFSSNIRKQFPTMHSLNDIKRKKSVIGKNKILSAHEYHLANLDIFTNKSEFTIPGTSIHNDNAYTDWNTSISPDAYIGRNIFIGNSCQISSLARLEQNCVLSEGVIIGKRTVLNNVTVLPNCNIASDIIISNSIITPNGVLNFDGHFYSFKETGLINNSKKYNETVTGLPTLTMKSF